jgi:hypothetical protein
MGLIELAPGCSARTRASHATSAIPAPALGQKATCTCRTSQRPRACYTKEIQIQMLDSRAYNISPCCQTPPTLDLMRFTTVH